MARKPWLCFSRSLSPLQPIGHSPYEGSNAQDAYVLILLYLITLGLTFTRGTILCVPVSLIIIVLFLPSRKLKVAFIGGGGAIASLAVFLGAVSNNPLFERFFNSDITTLNGRTYLWQATLNHFDPSHILGYGLKASDALLINLRVGFGGLVIDNATHNIFLEALYDHGIIGLVLLTAALIALGIAIVRKMRRASPDHRMMLATASAIFFSMMFQSTETNDFWTQSIAPYFWIAMALPFAFYWDREEQPSKVAQDPFDERSNDTSIESNTTSRREASFLCISRPPGKTMSVSASSLSCSRRSLEEQRCRLRSRLANSRNSDTKPLSLPCGTTGT